MMKPSKIEFEIGQTVYGQPLVLTRYREHSGTAWSLRRLQGDQRDDEQVILGLTRNVILAMAEAVKNTPEV